MSLQEVYVLGTDGNLWLEQGPFHGVQIPPPRVQVDGSVDLFAAFQAIDSLNILVCGTDGNLWYERGPFGSVPLPDMGYPPNPSSRSLIDGSVGAFQYSSSGEIFVLGQDGNLWIEHGFGTTVPAVPPPRDQIDGSVTSFQPLSLTEVFVLGEDGNLWHERAPFGTVPLPPCNGATSGCRTQVGANVRDFMAADSNNVFVIDTNNDLWLVQGPLGAGAPEPTHVDGNVAEILVVDAETVFVVGLDGNLWQENAPFGQVPLPLCSQTSGFGEGFGCRTLVFSRVAAFGIDTDAGGTFVIDFDLNLFALGTPNVQIDGSVIAFQPLSPEQMLSRSKGGSSPRAAQARPLRPAGLRQSRTAKLAQDGAGRRPQPSRSPLSR